MTTCLTVGEASWRLHAFLREGLRMTTCLTVGEASGRLHVLEMWMKSARVCSLCKLFAPTNPLLKKLNFVELMPLPQAGEDQATSGCCG